MARHSGDHEEKDMKSGSETEEVSIDFKKLGSSIMRFLAPTNKTAKLLLMAFFILLPIILTVYIRLQPWDLPQTDVWAQSSVENYFKNQMANAINQQYPNLPTKNKNELIDQQWTEFKKANQAMLDNQVKVTSESFKQGFRFEENGRNYTFLGDLDSYFFLRQARNLNARATICDEFRDGKCWDNHMIAPIGTEQFPSMHPYGIVYLYRFLKMFMPSINLMQASFYLPTVLAVIAAIAAFFIGRRIMNDVAGFFASMFLAISPMFISRTLGSDTDIWNIMFALLILWAFLEALEGKKIWVKMIFAGVTGLLIGMFSFAWSAGWWYIWYLILFAIISYIIFTAMKNYLRHRNGRSEGHIIKRLFTKEIKEALIVLGVFFVSCAIFITLFVGFRFLTVAFKAPFVFLSAVKAATNPTIWPNVITTVAEMNEAGLEAIISQTSFGLYFLFAISLIGIVLTLVKTKPGIKEYVIIAASALLYFFLVSKQGMGLNLTLYFILLLMPVAISMFFLLLDKESDVDIRPAIILVIWFIGMIFASTKGVRFILLVIPAFSVALGVALGYVHQYVVRILKEELNLHETISKIVVFLLICVILITPIKAGMATGASFTPSMTKGWWDSLTQIKEESKPDAIINSWWDFGHWFKYVADRKVTLDGASQNHPNAHWLGRILQTDNEDEAVAILRMIDCGSNNAFEEINKKYDDTEVSQNIVHELMLLNDRERSAEYLKGLGFSDEAVNKILEQSYCDPPENYFITSEDMVGKAGVWAHFGLWDFDKAYIINNLRKKSLDEATRAMKERWNYADEYAAQVYYEVQSLQTDRSMNDWISPWPNYFTGGWTSCKEVVNLKNTTATTAGMAAPNSTNATNATESSIEKSIENSTEGLNSQEVVPEVESRFLVCGIGRVVNQDANGHTSVDGLMFDLEDYYNSSLIIGGYDSSGMRRGSGEAIPSGFVLLNNESMKRISMENVTLPFDVIVDLVNQRIMMADPLLSQSLFTKLFFMDGKYTTHFEKFSDMQDITGSRIIIWKVKW